MELRRFFVNESDIENGYVTLAGGEFEHMTRVLRLKTGFLAVILANDGIERVCQIVSIDKNSARLKINEEREVDFKNKRLTLFLGLLKNNKLDFAVQKAVELGVDEIVPFISANCAETKFNAERADKIALEAAKQCGSVYLSKVADAVSFDDVCARIEEFDIVLIAYENEKQLSIKKADIKGDNVALIVGPEGGFKPEEILKAVSNGAIAVSLGRRILRAETACIVAAALTLDKLGELDIKEVKS